MMQKRMALPLMVAMALFLGSWATPGSAQTLDELEAQIRELSKRLQDLEAKQEQLEEKTDETRVDSRTVISGKHRVKLTVSGQVNRGLRYVDNGDKDDFFNVDNDHSSPGALRRGRGADRGHHFGRPDRGPVRVEFDRRDARRSLYWRSLAQTPQGASIAATCRGTRPPQVLEAQGAIGCSRRAGPIQAA